MRRRGLMDAGDADGADALLSLAALANEAANMPLPPLPESVTRELESKLDDLAAQAAEPRNERPRRARTAPARADVRASPDAGKLELSFRVHEASWHG